MCSYIPILNNNYSEATGASLYGLDLILDLISACYFSPRRGWDMAVF